MLNYSLVVSRGYVRLVRQGERALRPRPARPLGPPPEWEDLGVTDHDPAVDWDIQEAFRSDDEAAWWADPLEHRTRRLRPRFKKL